MALQDKIGREEIVDKICGLVGSLKKDKNFCLAINGAWGSGKSFVLGLIEEILSEKQEYIIIKYDAWENTFYSDPLIAILSCILDGLEDKLSKMRGYRKVAADFGKKKGKEIVDHQFRKQNLRKGGTDRQKDNIVSFIKFIFINETRTKPRSPRLTTRRFRTSTSAKWSREP